MLILAYSRRRPTGPLAMAANLQAGIHVQSLAKVSVLLPLVSDQITSMVGPPPICTVGAVAKSGGAR